MELIPCSILPDKEFVLKRDKNKHEEEENEANDFLPDSPPRTDSKTRDKSTGFVQPIQF